MGENYREKDRKLEREKSERLEVAELKKRKAQEKR